jgi:hypothetical protein
MSLLLLHPLHYHVCTDLPFDHTRNWAFAKRRADDRTAYHADVIRLSHLRMS